MRLPQPRFTVRRMMVTVAITGLLMGWAVHARSVLHEDEDFGFGVLLVECVGTLILSVFALPIVFAIYLVRQGDAYATRPRRDAARYRLDLDPGQQEWHAPPSSVDPFR
jgi:hypothetical protein